MKRLQLAMATLALRGSVVVLAEEQHSHPAPERLGKVTFPTSCAPSAQAPFERAVALLHSFAYTQSARAFRKVTQADPAFAIARWGIAMSLYHQLWSPPSEAELREGQVEIDRAREFGAGTARELQFVDAIAADYRNSDQQPPAVRAQAYATAMAEVARNNPSDSEAQIFYALSLIATASPSDKTHANQRRAADILEPLFQALPQHPGLAHYLLHACDSVELAPR